MRKALALLLLLVSVMALNVSVECTGPCLAYIPASGNAMLNYSVDGRELDDVFTEAFTVNATGSMVNTLMKFNLTQYSCENPSTAFVNNSLETAFFDDFLLAKVDLSASNTTVKLFCSGFNTERSQASWYGVGTATKHSSENLTYNGTKTVLSGLNFLNSTAMGLNNTFPNSHAVELGRGNITIANISTSSNIINVTMLNKDFQLQEYLVISAAPDEEAINVYMDFGNISNSYTEDNTKFHYIISHSLNKSLGGNSYGNITILNEDLTINGTLKFSGTTNQTQSVAISQVGSAGANRIVACTNYTNTLTIIEHVSGGWSYSLTNMTCPTQIYTINRNSSYGRGGNGALVGFDSSYFYLIWFNSTGWPFQLTYSMSNIRDMATFDADGQGHDEIVVMTSDGEVKIYNISSESASSITLSELSYLGNWGSAKIDAWDELLIDNNTLSLYNYSNALTSTASVSYMFPEAVPVKVSLNFTTGGTGNVTVNVTSGIWYQNQTWSSAQDVELDIYPAANQTLWINFTFSALNSTGEPWVVVNNLSVDFANSSSVNYSSYTAYSPVALNINTSVNAGGTWNFVGAEFDDMFTLDYLIAYLSGGNYSFQLDFPEYATSFSKPSIGSTIHNQWINVSSAIQGSQSEGNFSAVVGFENLLYLVEEDLNLTTYGTVVDYCVHNGYLVYTWNASLPKATLLRWDGSLSEIGNATGNFSECWLNGTNVFLVNSSGGVDIYDYALSKVDGFLNTSFVVQDIIMADQLYLWNGSHKAYAAPAYFTADSSFTLDGVWTSRIYKAEQVYHGTNFTEVVDAPTGDMGGDSIWEKFKSAVFSLAANIARLLGLPSGSYSSFENNVSVAFDNGTIRTYETNLTTPRTGWFTNFLTNTTSGSGWISFNSSDTFQINVSVTDFVYNSTDTLNSFNMMCSNGTYSQDVSLTKTASNEFSIEDTIPDSKYSCSIYPQWDTSLPLTFSTYDFTMYVDSQTPNITSVTTPSDISSQQNFNITVNVTEDSEIQTFSITPDKEMPVTISGFTLLDGTYQIYTVTLSINRLTFPTSNLTLNISATDYTGKKSTNFTTGIITIYDSSPPTRTIRNVAPSNNLQDFAETNLTLAMRFTSDADIDYVNITLWQGQNLQSYSEATSIDNTTYTLWLNDSLSADTADYVVRVTATDITGYVGQTNFNVSRFGSLTKNFTGKWYSSTTGTTKVYWENDFVSGGITDTDTGTNTTNSATFTVTLKTPNKNVDEWYIQNNASTSIDYIRFRYDDSLPPVATFKEYIYASSYVFGVNLTVEPDDVLVRGERTIGSSEKMCLKICDEYDVDSGTCSSSWVEESCATQGTDEKTFVVSGSDQLLDNIVTGTGFRVDKVTVSSDTTDDTTGTQTTTSTVGSSVITITAPTSKSVAVDSCIDVTFTVKNSGSATGSISSITASGFVTSEMTYTMLSDIDFPYSLGVDKKLYAILSFCPLTAKTFNPSVCAKVGSASKCVTVKIIGEGDAEEEEEELPLNLTVSVETFEDEYIVLVNTTQGPVEGATVTITYSDGTIENYTTNVFGKINFLPKLADFTVKVLHDGETIEKTIEELTEPLGLTLWRILVDLLIIAVLIGFGVILDEKML